MTVACAVTAQQVDALAAAPGAVSVWGDEEMAPVGGGPRSAAAASGRSAAAVSPLGGPAGATGEGVGIAVLDTGVDGSHSELTNGSKTVLNARMVVSNREIQGPGGDSCVP